MDSKKNTSRKKSTSSMDNFVKATVYDLTLPNYVECTLCFVFYGFQNVNAIRSAFKVLDILLRNTILGVRDKIPNYVKNYFRLP